MKMLGSPQSCLQRSCTYKGHLQMQMRLCDMEMDLLRLQMEEKKDHLEIILFYLLPNTTPIGMAALILTLQLVLLLTFGFTESSEDPTRAEPHLDLQCLNNFLTEMMCLLTSQSTLENCSGYSLNVSHQDKTLTCDFKQLNNSECKCIVQQKSGFVLGENYKVKMLRWNSLLFTKNVSTTESIKPKKPVIVSVNQTQNGNIHIVCNSIYRTEEKILSEHLILELTYYIEGSRGSEKTETLALNQWEYELVGRNLESTSNYIVRARVKSNLNSRFSDYSDPYKFTTPSSPKDLLKIIIPIVCVILIICIFTIYYSYNKILTEWWDKIPTPKIATSFVKQVPNLLSFQNEFSSVHLDSSKLVHSGEKTWPAPSLVDVGCENSHSSLGKDGTSAEVIYGQTGNESLEENSSENIMHWELVKEAQSAFHRQMPMSKKYYKNLKSDSDDCNVQRESQNSSGFSNKFYMMSDSDKFPKPATHFISDLNVSENVFPALAKNLEPVKLADFEDGPCTGCSLSENTSPTQFTSSTNDIDLVPGYQSVSENASCEPAIIPAEDGYKDIHSLLQNSGEQQCFTTETELKHLCGPTLNTSQGIQIDCSYHRV
ncbi:hypothetical protein AMELA_G00249620 [Ameiurus melas]|uniref:Interleukin-4 receptor alpha chain n=1 Tax=Ameiurus melas TaxID=219545 RepID=A0A7J5ZXL6_AMEME|nr:hypothetical protein AMELA_G00249620 [Ameiurus melas]